MTEAPTTTRPRPRSAIERMAPYHPPTGGRLGAMRLDFNENTVGCSPKVVEALRKAIRGVRWRRPEREVEARVAALGSAK